MTFTSLFLNNINVRETSLEVFWGVKLDYYYTDYDWGLIFRQIGEDSLSENMFFKTRYNLKNHLDSNTDWTPKSENLTAIIGGLKSGFYYEVCLAVVEHSTVYYVHRDLCREIRALDESIESNDKSVLLTSHEKHYYDLISTRNVTVVPSSNSVTLTWKIEVNSRSKKEENWQEMGKIGEKNAMISVIRQISIRKFGSENATQLFVLEDFNRTALLLSSSNKNLADSSR